MGDQGRRGGAAVSRSDGPQDDAEAGLDRATMVLKVILGTAIAVSLVHGIDDTWRYDSYRPKDPAWYWTLFQPWVIVLNWVVFTRVAVVGYQRFRQGRWSKAVAWIGAYSASLLFALVHYTDTPFSYLSAVQNTFILGEVVMGAIALGVALWIARQASGLPSTGGASRPESGVGGAVIRRQASDQPAYRGR